MDLPLKPYGAETQVLLVAEDVHSETEMAPETENTPGGLCRIKLNWRTTELDELISLADDMVIGQEINQKKKTKLHEARAARKTYSLKVVPADKQLPPKGFPKCLIKQTFLDELGELTVDMLKLSDTVINLKSANLDLKKRAGKGNAMVLA